MNLTTNQALHDLYAVTQLFRQLEFPAEDIYVTPNVTDQTGRRCWGVELRQGELRFTVYVVPVDDVAAAPVFMALWTKFAENANAAEGVEKLRLERYVKQSAAWQQKGAILGTLVAKGFKIPLVASRAR